ncbi:MAG: CBS domain-containing protein [Candidatus Marinimicrobia bacterium]|nr:CBS domain-containing protein [Candidatus Neomarinimicrobiota bacterium]
MLKSLQAKDVMLKETITIGPNVSLRKAVKQLVENKVSSMPVVDDTGKLIGIISCENVLNVAFDGYINTTKVETVMTKNVVYFEPDTNLEEIALVISKKHFHRIPIVKDGKLVGTVTRRAIVKKIFDLE